MAKDIAPLSSIQDTLCKAQDALVHSRQFLQLLGERVMGVRHDAEGTPLHDLCEEIMVAEGFVRKALLDSLKKPQ